MAAASGGARRTTAPSDSAASESRVGSRKALNRLLRKVKSNNSEDKDAATGLGQSTRRKVTEVKEHHRRRRRRRRKPPHRVTEHQIQQISIIVSPPLHLQLALLWVYFFYCFMASWSIIHVCVCVFKLCISATSLDISSLPPLTLKLNQF